MIGSIFEGLFYAVIACFAAVLASKHTSYGKRAARTELSCKFSNKNTSLGILVVGCLLVALGFLLDQSFLVGLGAGLAFCGLFWWSRYRKASATIGT